MMKESNIYTTDQDEQLSELFGQLRETVVQDDGFSDGVMLYIPRRDISMWVISFACLCGVAVAGLLIGKENLILGLEYFKEFFYAMGRMEVPSKESLMAAGSVLAILGVMIYAILDTDDYCENNFV